MFKLIPRKIFFLLLLLAFIIKLASAYYMAHLRKCLTPEKISTVIASKDGDASFYVDPIDNYIEKGEYFYSSGTEKITMGRAPYYGITYFIFRVFLPREVSYDMVAVLQLLIESLSIMYLCGLCMAILKSRLAFLLTYVLMMLSLNSTFWSTDLLTESLSISFLVFFSWHYYHYLINRSRLALFLSGLFLSFTVLLKPYFVLVFVPIGFLFLLEKPFSIKKIFADTIIISGTLILLSTPYTIRNFVRFNKFMPGTQLYGGYNFSKSNLACREFIRSWGGSIMYWDKRSAACYFEPMPDVPCEFVFPQYALCEGYSMKDVESVRNLYISFQKNPSPVLDDSVASEFNRLTSLFKKYKPFRYYFITPLLLTEKFLFNSGSYYLSISKSSSCYRDYQLLLKISQSLLYYFSLFAGFAGLIYIFKKDRRAYMLLFIPLFLLLFFPIVMQSTEFRYFAPSYPFLILGAICFCFQMYEYIKKFRNSVRANA